MGIQLNIKSAEARTLAERLAAATGTSITDAVTQSLRRRLAEVERDHLHADDRAEARDARLRTIVAGSRARWREPLLSLDHADMLYDANGLPR